MLSLSLRVSERYRVVKIYSVNDYVIELRSGKEQRIIEPRIHDISMILYGTTKKNGGKNVV